MSAQEFFPGGFTAPLRRRFDPLLLQDVRDGAATDGVPQVGQRPKYPPIAPIPIFRYQAHHQVLDLTESSGATGTPFLAAIVFPSDLARRWSRFPEEPVARAPSPWPPDVGVDCRSAGGACRPIALGVLGFPRAGNRSRPAAAAPNHPATEISNNRNGSKVGHIATAYQPNRA